jgi:hypothetical protein
MKELKGKEKKELEGIFRQDDSYKELLLYDFSTYNQQRWS